MDTRQPTEEFLRDIDVHELLLQQEPFVMIDRLTAFDETRTVTETVISNDNLFVTDGVLSASGLMENIAQTCAARIGYVNKYILHKGIQLGFLGAIRNFEVVNCPKAGDVITTCITVVDNVSGMTVAHGVVTCNGETIVTTEIKIAVREAE